MKAIVEIREKRRETRDWAILRIAFVSLVSCLLSLVSSKGSAQALPVDPTKGLYFNQNLGVQVPLGTHFKDETGKDITLGDYFNKGKPVVLVLVFYNCQSSCLLIRDGLLTTLNSQKKLRVGEDFDVIAVSINHKEEPALAKQMKDMYVSNYRYPGSADGWHLLTGTKENIRKLTDTVGFGFKYKEEIDPVTKKETYQFTHPSGIILLSPEGITSLYLLGVQYPAEILMKGLQDARVNKVGPKTETILFGCFMYDGQGKLRPVIQNILMVSGSATVLILFGSIAVMSFKHRRSPLYKSAKGGDAPV